MNLAGERASFHCLLKQPLGDTLTGCSMSFRPPSGARDVVLRRERAVNEGARATVSITSLLTQCGIGPPRRAATGGSRVPGVGTNMTVQPCVQRGISGLASVQPPSCALPRSARNHDDHFRRASGAQTLRLQSQAKLGRFKRAPGTETVLAPDPSPSPDPDADGGWGEIQLLAAALPADAAAFLRLPYELMLVVLGRLNAVELARVAGCSRMLWLASSRIKLWRPLWKKRWLLRPPLSLFQPRSIFVHTPLTEPSEQPCCRAQYAAAALCLMWTSVPQQSSDTGLSGGDSARSSGPLARAFAASVSLRGGMLVHGGYSTLGEDAFELHNGVLSDVHWLRPEAGTARPCWQWFTPTAAGMAPRRSHHAATLTCREEAVFCGGSDGFHRVPHVNILDTETWTWNVARPVGDVPLGISDHACAATPTGGILLVGKSANTGDVTWTDRWEIRLEEVEEETAGRQHTVHWVHNTRVGGSLSARAGHTIAIAPDATKLLVLGGRAFPMMEIVRISPASAHNNGDGGEVGWRKILQPNPGNE